MISIQVENVSPIMHFDGSDSSATVSFSFKVYQYLFVTIFIILPKKKIPLDLSSPTPIFLLQSFLQGNLQKTPYMLYVRGNT